MTRPSEGLEEGRTNVRLGAETDKLASEDARRRGMKKSSRMRMILRLWYSLPRTAQATLETWDGSEEAMVSLPKLSPGTDLFGVTG